MLIFMGIKLAISLAIGIIALPICTSMNLYRLIKYGAYIVEYSNA
jgi:hypothetical protein